MSRDLSIPPGTGHSVDVTHILENLNERQREAVTAPVGNALVVAGAGSGKTRVLVHRIAWLIEAEKASPQGILAVTFTNKAAAEMRMRIEELLQHLRSHHVGGHLSRHCAPASAHALAGGRPAAELPDSGCRRSAAAGQTRHARAGYRRAEMAARQAVWFINSQKDEGRRAKDVACRRRPVPDHPQARLRELRGALQSGRAGGFCRAAAAQS